MKLALAVTFIAVAAIGFVGGARSTRPDLTLSATEELSIIRAEVAFTSAPLAPDAEKDPAKIKALVDAKEAKRQKALGVASAIRKSHNCEACVMRWDVGLDGAVRLAFPDSQPQKKEQK